ncbi:MAG: Hypothetical protein AJITA_00551 [Acetilactobacillus jinshanensis]
MNILQVSVRYVVVTTGYPEVMVVNAEFVTNVVSVLPRTLLEVI